MYVLEREEARLPGGAVAQDVAAEAGRVAHHGRLGLARLRGEIYIYIYIYIYIST